MSKFLPNYCIKEPVINSKSKYGRNNNAFIDNNLYSYKREVAKLRGPKIVGKIDPSSINHKTYIKKKNENDICTSKPTN